MSDEQPFNMGNGIEQIRGILGRVDAPMRKRLDRKADERLASTIGLARAGNPEANVLIAIMFLKLAEYIHEQAE